MKIQPIFDRVLLAPEEDAQTTSGIYIPKAVDDKSNVMRVVDKGNSTNVENNERVIVAKYAGTEVSIGNKRFLLVCEHDILGVIK